MVDNIHAAINRLRHKVGPIKPDAIWRGASRLFFSKAHRLEGLREVRGNSEFQALRTRVRAAGTDSLSHFGNGYVEEGGLYLQQNPDEFAALCLLLQRHAPIHNYLEIGSASGGSCRFIYENVGFDRALCLDDGQHARAAEQPGNFAHIKNLTRFIGDSHSKEARRFLAEQVRDPIDVAFIDGDHSYEGVWADIRLALAFSRPGTLFVFHDTIACDGVEKAWLEVLQRGLVKGVAEYVGEERPLGIAAGMVR